MKTLNIKEYIQQIQLETKNRNYDDYVHIFEEYKSYLEDYIKENSRDIEAICQLAAVYFELRHGEKPSINMIENLLSYTCDEMSANDKARAYTNLAFFYEESGDSEKQLHYLKEATLQNADFPNAYDAFGRFYADNGDTENSSVTTHQLVLSWNFDNPYKVINWVIDNPKTDRATALLLYWLMTPSYAKGFANRDEVVKKSNWYVEEFDIIEKLEERYLAGFYQNQSFGFNPYCDAWKVNRVAENSDKGKREIPQAMTETLKGKEIAIPENWNDGIPSDLQEEYAYLISLLDKT